MHHHKHRKHFSITLLVSIAIHLFILTVLFTLPASDDQDGYKKVRVKLGVRSDTTAENIQNAQKYASYSPGAAKTNQSAVNGNSTRSLPPIPAKAAIESPQQIVAKTAKDSASVAPEVTEKQPESAAQAPELQRVMEQTAKKITIPEQEIAPAAGKDTTSADDEDGTIIGNSVAKDADKLASYEQMLPLWLDKFKKYPEEAQAMHITGTGEIFIKIDRKGKVLLSKIIKSTGSPALDKALMNMIADADPVVPVPLDYHPDKKTFSYKIAFEFNEPK